MHSRTYATVMAAFVATVLVSNISSAAKIVDFGVSLYGIPLAFDAGTLLFPLSYIFGDILTELYGFRGSRRVIWTGFVLSAAMSAYLFLVGIMPGEVAWLQYAGNDAYAAILGGVSSGGIVIASLSAYLMGELSNSFSMERIKQWTQGKFLPLRTIGSTLVGQGIDTVSFVLIACTFNVFPWEIAVSLILANYIFKVGIEVLFTPMTIVVIRWLQKIETDPIA
ncbi:MAG TPA: queuosine precursor transporter [Candidatus Peribacterales bacterium]|nr:queuosine precursor transporter [Candidatus Peribacterales bacterium]